MAPDRHLCAHSLTVIGGDGCCDPFFMYPRRGEGLPARRTHRLAESRAISGVVACDGVVRAGSWAHRLA